MVWWLTSQEPVAAVTGGKIATAAHAAAQRLGSTRECGTQNQLGLTSPPAGSRRAKGESHTAAPAWQKGRPLPIPSSSSQPDDNREAYPLRTRGVQYLCVAGGLDWGRSGWAGQRQP